MFNKKLTVASRLAFGFGALLLLMVVVALIGVSRLQDVEEITNTLTDKDRLVAYAITDIEALVRSNGLAVLELTIVKDVARMEHLRKEITRNRSKRSDALSTVESVDGEVSHRPLLADIVRARVTAADSIDKVLKLIEDGRREDAIATVTSETIPFLTATQAAIATLSASESKIIISRAADVKRITNAAYAMIFTVNGIAIGIAILIALSISRKLTGQLGGEPEYVACVAKAVAAGDLTMIVETKDGDKSSLLFSMKEMCFRLSCNILRVQTGTDTIASATNQIAAGNLDLSARTEQQASALEETASSMEQLSSTVKQNADNAKQANTLAISASDVASRGGKVVSEVVDTMGAINDSAKKSWTSSMSSTASPSRRIFSLSTRRLKRTRRRARQGFCCGRYGGAQPGPAFRKRCEGNKVLNRHLSRENRNRQHACRPSGRNDGGDCRISPASDGHHERNHDCKHGAGGRHSTDQPGDH